MKPTVFFGLALSVVVMAGCAGNGRPKNSDVSQQIADSIAVPAACAYYAAHVAEVVEAWKKPEICGEADPKEFAFYDIDGDGREELFLRNMNNEVGNNFAAIMNCADDHITMLAGSNYRVDMEVMGKFIHVVNSGAGFSDDAYIALENSVPKGDEELLITHLVSNSEEDEDGIQTLYRKRDIVNNEFTDITEKDAKSFLAEMPSVALDTAVLDWHPFAVLSKFCVK